MEEKLALNYVTDALQRAREIHPDPFYDPHQGYAIIKEELDELWDVIKTRPLNHFKMKIEVSHVAATTIRFLTDLL